MTVDRAKALDKQFIRAVQNLSTFAWPGRHVPISYVHACSVPKDRRNNVRGLHVMNGGSNTWTKTYRSPQYLRVKIGMYALIHASHKCAVICFTTCKIQYKFTTKSNKLNISGYGLLITSSNGKKFWLFIIIIVIMNKCKYAKLQTRKSYVWRVITLNKLISFFSQITKALLIYL